MKPPVTLAMAKEEDVSKVMKREKLRERASRNFPHPAWYIEFVLWQLSKHLLSVEEIISCFTHDTDCIAKRFRRSLKSTSKRIKEDSLELITIICGGETTSEQNSPSHKETSV